MKRNRAWWVGSIATASLVTGFATGCGSSDQESGTAMGRAAEQAAADASRAVEDTAEATGKTLEDNVARSMKVGKETYEADRARGEDVVESAGDAYNAVLDESRKKEEDAE